MRLTRRQWAEAEALWSRGDHTLKDISDRFDGVRPETISTHMKAAGIVKGEAADMVKEEMEGALRRREKKFAEQRAERIIQSREELYAIARSLTIGVAKTAHEARTKNEPLGIHLNTIKAHKEAIAAISLGRQEIYRILNYDPTEIEDEDLPDLVVREMTEQEEVELRRQQQEDDATMEALRQGLGNDGDEDDEDR